MASEGSRSSEIGGKAKTHPGLPGPRTLALVDVFLFLADARIPLTSIRLAEPYLRSRRRVYVLTKPDLADEGRTQQWLSYLRENYGPTYPVDCRNGRGIDDLLAHLRTVKEGIDRARKTPNPRPIRVMLFGLPNVGKSSLANRLLGTRKAPFGAKPGLTRGSHWLKGSGFIEVLDTPGVVDSSGVKGESRMKLAAAWALPENAYDSQEVAFWLATKVAGTVDPLAYLNEFGAHRGFIGPGGTVDLDRACRAFIQAFREGQLGRFTLESPDEAGESSGPASGVSGS